MFSAVPLVSSAQRLGYSMVRRTHFVYFCEPAAPFPARLSGAVRALE